MGKLKTEPHKPAQVRNLNSKIQYSVKSTAMLTEKPSRLRTRINLKLHFGEQT